MALKIKNIWYTIAHGTALAAELTSNRCATTYMKRLYQPQPPAAADSPRPRVDVIADALRTAIVSGAMAPGEPLRQDAIAAEFGVSHIPVREALRHLAAEGLVSLKRNHGATVRGMAPDEALELLEIRGTLETQALRWALPKADAALCDEAEGLLAEAEREQDPGAWLAINWRFHRLLYDRAGRPRLMELIEGLDRQIDRFVRLLLTRSDYRFQAQAEHRAILAAYRVGNAVAVCSLTEQHLAETARRLADCLADPPEREGGRIFSAPR